jgi:hypothetical protein
MIRLRRHKLFVIPPFCIRYDAIRRKKRTHTTRHRTLLNRFALIFFYTRFDHTFAFSASDWTENPSAASTPYDNRFWLRQLLLFRGYSLFHTRPFGALCEHTDIICACDQISWLLNFYARCSPLLQSSYFFDILVLDFLHQQSQLLSYL